MIERLAFRLGFVPRPALEAAKEKLRAVRQQLEKTKRQVADATAAVEQLKKARRDDGQRHEARLAAVVSEHEERLANATAELNAKASKQIAKLEEELRKRDERLEAALRGGQALEEQTAAAGHELELARAYLMAIEVKLDILEGAANVLDARLRAGRAPAGDGPPRQSASTGS